MSAFTPDSFLLLGLESGATEREVKRAYAARLKLIDASKEPARFMELRTAYEQALAWANWLAENEAAVRAEAFVGPVVSKASEREASPAQTNQEMLPAPAEEGVPIANNATSNAEPPPTSGDLSPVNALHSPDTESFEPPVGLSFLARRRDDPVTSAFEEFRSSLTFANSDLPAALKILKSFLGRATLSRMADRERFVSMLVEAISARDFGSRTAVMLLAAAEAFGWEEDSATQLLHMGVAGQQVWQLLTELVLLGPKARQRWLLLTEEPSPEAALKLITASERPDSISPLLGKLFFPEGHIRAWQSARSNAPQLMRLRAGASTVLRDGRTLLTAGGFLARHMGVKGVMYLLLIPATIVILSMVLSWAQKKEGDTLKVSCDKAYASAIAKSWKGLSVHEVGVMDACAASSAPLLCSDRDALVESIGHAQRLLNREYFLPYADVQSKQIRLDLPDGRRFAFDENAQCAELWRFANTANWLGEADAVAASQLIVQLAQCQEMKTENPAFRELLARTDAWPAAAGPQARISVKQLVDEAQRPPLTSTLKTIKPWPACAPAFDSSLATPMGEMEFVAASNRARSKARP